MDNLADIIIENEGLIYKIINKYKNYFEIEDLYQVAVMGLIKASKNYNSEYGAKFTSYAYPYILDKQTIDSKIKLNLFISVEEDITKIVEVKKEEKDLQS